MNPSYSASAKEGRSQYFIRFEHLKAYNKTARKDRAKNNQKPIIKALVSRTRWPPNSRAGWPAKQNTLVAAGESTQSGLQDQHHDKMPIEILGESSGEHSRMPSEIAWYITDQNIPTRSTKEKGKALVRSQPRDGQLLMGEG